MSGDTVQQIKDRLSIVDVVAPYVELHQAGKSLKGKSPFTQEKTPSFFVSPDRGMYYCFSTSKGGDIFTFVQEMEGVEFKEALTILAEKAGVELVPEDPKKRTEREEGYAVLEEATQFFETTLRKHDTARSYLSDRGVTDTTIQKWRIGYAPGPPKGGWRDTRTHLQAKKYTDTQLTKTGLIKSAGEGKEPYDVFRDRVMFPIFDQSGKVVAFSGRILEKDSEAPKYVNSPETAFFNKSEILYGYDKAKTGIRKFDFSLIVEGQFDVVLAHQAGYSNTVAVSGTALTEYHIRLLQRLSNRVVLALDADRAGIAAVKRAAELMLSRGIDVKVARVPEGADPADIIKENPQEFKDIISRSVHVIEFLLAVLKEQAKDDRTYKLTVRDEVLPYIAHMENKIDAEHFEGVVAVALDTTKDAIHLEVARIIESGQLERPKRVDEVIEQKQRSKHTISRQAGLLQVLLVATELVDTDRAERIQSEVERITGTAFATLQEALTAEERSRLSFELERQFTELLPKQLDAELSQKLNEFTLLTIREKLSTAKEALFVAEHEGDEVLTETLLQQVGVLQKELATAGVVEDVFADATED